MSKAELCTRHRRLVALMIKACARVERAKNPIDVSHAAWLLRLDRRSRIQRALSLVVLELAWPSEGVA